MTTPDPQAGILPEPGPSALFLVLDVDDHARHAAMVGRIAASVPALCAKLAAADRGTRLVANVGIGPELWDVL